MKEDPGNYKPVSLNPIPGKVIEQILLEAISKHLKWLKVVGNKRHRFTEGKLFLTAFCDGYLTAFFFQRVDFRPLASRLRAEVRSVASTALCHAIF